MNLLRFPRTHRFIEEMAKTNVASPREAALNAGFSVGTASNAVAKLLADPAVLAAIEERRAAVAQLANISPALVLKQWLDVATADPSKLIRVRRLNCRHCWGKDHKYQWTEWEYAQRVKDVLEWRPTKRDEKRPEFPDGAGGMGFTFNADPSPDCPRCLGEGVVDVFIADSSTLTGPERALFAGVKVTKDGIQVLMHDQAAMWKNISDYLRMTSKDGPTPPQGGYGRAGGDVVDVAEVLPDDPNKLALMYQQWTKGEA